jgi:hypothetical protein
MAVFWMKKVAIFFRVANIYGFVALEKGYQIFNTIFVMSNYSKTESTMM